MLVSWTRGVFLVRVMTMTEAPTLVKCWTFFWIRIQIQTSGDSETSASLESFGRNYFVFQDWWQSPIAPKRPIHRIPIKDFPVDGLIIGNGERSVRPTYRGLPRAESPAVLQPDAWRRLDIAERDESVEWQALNFSQGIHANEVSSLC